LFEEFRVAAKEKVEAAGTALLAKFREVLPKISGWLETATTWMENWGGSTDDVKDAVNRFLIVAGPYIRDLGTIAGLLFSIAKWSLKAGAAMIRLNNAIGNFLASGIGSILGGMVPNISAPIPGNERSAVGERAGNMTNINNRFDAVEIKIDGSDIDAGSIANAVGAALLDLGRAGAISRGGIAVTP